MNQPAKLPGSRRRGLLWAGLLAAAAVLVTGVLLFRSLEPVKQSGAESVGGESGRFSSSPDAELKGKGSRRARGLAAQRPMDSPGMASANLAGKRDRLEGRTFLRITGIVADIEGNTLEGAQLRWLPLGMRQAWQFSLDEALTSGQAERVAEGPLRDALLDSQATRTDSQGRYELEADQPRSGVVAAWAPGYETVLKGVGLSEGRRAESALGDVPEATANFFLRFGGAVSGTVFEQATGHPAQGMAVAAFSRDLAGDPSTFFIYGSRTPAALVDSQGRYKLQGLAEGTYLVAPQTAGSLYVSMDFEAGREVNLQAGSEVPHVDFEVRRGGRIWGRALSPSGEAIPGVRCVVIAERAEGRSKVATARTMLSRNRQATGLDGRFEFLGLPLNRTYRVRGYSRDIAEVLSEPIALNARSPQAEVDLIMAVGSRIFGQVLFADGRIPQKGALVRAFPLFRGSGSFMVHPGRTDSQGGFVLGPLNAGEYRLRVSSRRSSWRQSGQQPLLVKVDGRRDVSGILLEVEELKQEEVGGMVVDDLGRPLEGAAVQASSSQGFGFVSTGSQPDGTFSLKTRGEGPFQITAEKASYDRDVIADVEAGSWVQLILQRPGQVSGRVKVVGGGPLPEGGRVELIAVQPGSESRRPLESGTFVKPGSDGAFRMECKAGPIELVALYPGFAPVRSKTITVRWGEEIAGIELVLRR